MVVRSRDRFHGGIASVLVSHGVMTSRLGIGLCEPQTGQVGQAHSQHRRIGPVEVDGVMSDHAVEGFVTEVVQLVRNHAPQTRPLGQASTPTVVHARPTEHIDEAELTRVLRVAGRAAAAFASAVREADAVLTAIDRQRERGARKQFEKDSRSPEAQRAIKREERQRILRGGERAAEAKPGRTRGTSLRSVQEGGEVA